MLPTKHDNLSAVTKWQSEVLFVTMKNSPYQSWKHSPQQRQLVALSSLRRIHLGSSQCCWCVQLLIISPRNGVYIAIGSDQKLTVFFAKQVRQMITNHNYQISLLWSIIQRKSSYKICRMRHYLSRNVHEIILFCINQCVLKEFAVVAVVRPMAFVTPLNSICAVMYL